MKTGSGDQSFGDLLSLGVGLIKMPDSANRMFSCKVPFFIGPFKVLLCGDGRCASSLHQTNYLGQCLSKQRNSEIGLDVSNRYRSSTVSFSSANMCTAHNFNQQNCPFNSKISLKLTGNPKLTCASQLLCLLVPSAEHRFHEYLCEDAGLYRNQ